MRTTERFTINGQPLLVPDGDMVLMEEDVVSSDSGYDESGVYHRFSVRKGVKSWEFSYARLTREEYAYLEDLFAYADTFYFGFPTATNDQYMELLACRSKRSILWHDAATGEFRDYKFRITEC